MNNTSDETVIKETNDYKLIVQPSVLKENDGRNVYAVINTTYNVVEGEYPFLPVALYSIDDLQDSLDKESVKEANNKIIGGDTSSSNNNDNNDNNTVH